MNLNHELRSKRQRMSEGVALKGLMMFQVEEVQRGTEVPVAFDACRMS